VGYEVTIGMFNEKVRYVAFKKMSSKPWDEADFRACLMHIAPYFAWSTKPGSDYFDYSEKEGEKVIAEATGWYSAKYRHAFIYVPTLTGEVAILPDRSSLDPKI